MLFIDFSYCLKRSRYLKILSSIWLINSFLFVPTSHTIKSTIFANSFHAPVPSSGLSLFSRGYWLPRKLRFPVTDVLRHFLCSQHLICSSSSEISRFSSQDPQDQKYTSIALLQSGNHNTTNIKENIEPFYFSQSAGIRSPHKNSGSDSEDKFL